MDQLNAVCAILRLFVPGFGIAFFFRTDGTGSWPTDDSTQADTLTELIVGKRCVITAESLAQIKESLFNLALAHHEKMGEHLSQHGGWDPGWVSRGNQPWIGLPKRASVHKGDDPNELPGVFVGAGRRQGVGLLSSSTCMNTSSGIGGRLTY